MCFAILVHPIGQGTYAPVFHFHDLARVARRYRSSGGKFFDLLCTRILTREKNMLIKSMGVLSSVGAAPGDKPFEPSERTRYAQKAETRDDEPTGSVTSRSSDGEILLGPSVQLRPDPRMAPLYGF